MNEVDWYGLPTTLFTDPNKYNAWQVLEKNWKTLVKAQDGRTAIYFSWLWVPSNGMKWYFLLWKVWILWSSLDLTVISKRDGVFLCAFMFIFVINLHIPCINKSLFSITLECVPSECYRKAEARMCGNFLGLLQWVLWLSLLEINAHYTLPRTQNIQCLASDHPQGNRC